MSSAICTPPRPGSFAYETFGAVEGEPLLLTSGTGVQMLIWPDAFVAALAGRGFCVTRFDNP